MNETSFVDSTVNPWNYHSLLIGLKVIVALATVASVAGLWFWLRWMDRPANRMQRARRAVERDLSRLSEAASLVADVPRALRHQTLGRIASSQKATPRAPKPPEIQLPTLTMDRAVRHVLDESSSPLYAAQVCMAWLVEHSKTAGSETSLEQQVDQILLLEVQDMLRECLEPRSEMTLLELGWRGALSRRCREYMPTADWPALFEFGACSGPTTQKGLSVLRRR